MRVVFLVVTGVGVGVAVGSDLLLLELVGVAGRGPDGFRPAGLADHLIDRGRRDVRIDGAGGAARVRGRFAGSSASMTARRCGRGCLGTRAALASGGLARGSQQHRGGDRNRDPDGRGRIGKPSSEVISHARGTPLVGLCGPARRREGTDCGQARTPAPLQGAHSGTRPGSPSAVIRRRTWCPGVPPAGLRRLGWVRCYFGSVSGASGGSSAASAVCSCCSGSSLMCGPF